MGWFSKTVPRRRWPDVNVILGRKLHATGASWYSTFQEGTASHGFQLVDKAPTEAAKHYISMLQLSAVAATLQENGYVSDVAPFLELVYVFLTRNPPAKLHDDIETLPFARAGDAQRSLVLWARNMASELSPKRNDAGLIGELTSYGLGLVVQAKIATCVACGDQKGAEKVLQLFRD
jgi:hypothetical protein